MKSFDLKLALFFIVLTVVMTIGVIALWEEVLRPPFYTWVEARYPGAVHAQLRWNIQQRVEHFFISVMVDALVVTLLLRVVHRQQRKLRESEERYRLLSELTSDYAWSVAVEPDGNVRLEWVAGAFEDLYGAPFDQALMDDWTNVVHADDMQVAFAALELDRALDGEIDGLAGSGVRDQGGLAGGQGDELGAGAGVKPTPVDDPDLAADCVQAAASPRICATRRSATRGSTTSSCARA